ncbi:MAG TPA: hypothetical protein PKY12_12330, partial [Catalimonadaceae bacterium]|nr:hypothetical protein [Catalimonadaceae bacterium]
PLRWIQPYNLFMARKEEAAREQFPASELLIQRPWSIGNGQQTEGHLWIIPQPKIRFLNLM